MSWIIENREWVFSGVGIAIIGVVWGLFKRNKATNTNRQVLKAGDNSNNIQSSGNVTFSIGNKKDER